MLTSCSDSDFGHSNISFKENKHDGVDLKFNGLTPAFEKNKEEFYDFRQTEKRFFYVSTLNSFMKFTIFLGINSAYETTTY